MTPTQNYDVNFYFVNGHHVIEVRALSVATSELKRSLLCWCSHRWRCCCISTSLSSSESILICIKIRKNAVIIIDHRVESSYSSDLYAATNKKQIWILIIIIIIIIIIKPFINVLLLCCVSLFRYPRPLRSTSDQGLLSKQGQATD